MASNSAVSVPHEPAPPARNESKRERKRQLLHDRLQQMSENFSRGRDSAYREQLQKIQLDTNLIMRVDPYCERPLEALDLEQTNPALLGTTDPATAQTLLEMAGPRFRDFVHDIEDLVEERDYEITKQKVRCVRWTAVTTCIWTDKPARLNTTANARSTETCIITKSSRQGESIIH